MAKAIQFYGSETMLQAFNARGLAVWAIFSDRTLCVAGEGEEELKEYVEMLQSNPVPVYTLKVYKGVDADDVIDKTPCHGSFNFKLDGERANVSGTSDGRGAIGKVLKRIEEIESGYLLDYLDRLEERRAAKTENKLDIIGAVNNLINDPGNLVQALGIIKNLFSSNNQVQAVGISSIAPPGASHAMAAETPLEQQIERMQAAINILERNDPNLVVHLEKLARLSEENKPMFGFLLQNLDNLVK